MQTSFNINNVKVYDYVIVNFPIKPLDVADDFNLSWEKVTWTFLSIDHTTNMKEIEHVSKAWKMMIRSKPKTSSMYFSSSYD